MEQKIITNKSIKEAAVIVAHPDDETLWAGGTILMHPKIEWTVIALCRAGDADRMPKFINAINYFHAKGTIGDPDWRPRYEEYNRPGEYHNGGIWPFVCGFYIAALIAAGRHRLAEKKLNMLTELVRPACRKKVKYGFNEWLRARDGTPQGQDWQTWSAAMYLYAAHCVEQKRTPFFDEIRKS